MNIGNEQGVVVTNYCYKSSFRLNRKAERANHRCMADTGYTSTNMIKKDRYSSKTTKVFSLAFDK